MTGIVNRFYSGTPLIRSPMGQTNLAVLRGDRIDEGFLQENLWPFCQAAKKSGRNSEVAVRRGFTALKCTLMIFMLFMIDITRFRHGPDPKDKCVVRNYTLLRLIWSSACPSYVHFWTQVTQWRPVSNTGEVVSFVNGRCHFYNTWKIFDLVLRMFLLKRKNVASQGRTRTFRILISLPYHFTSSPIRQNYEKFKYIN